MDPSMTTLWDYIHTRARKIIESNSFYSKKKHSHTYRLWYRKGDINKRGTSGIEERWRSVRDAWGTTVYMSADHIIIIKNRVMGLCVYIYKLRRLWLTLNRRIFIQTIVQVSDGDDGLISTEEKLQNKKEIYIFFFDNNVFVHAFRYIIIMA